MNGVFGYGVPFDMFVLDQDGLEKGKQELRQMAKNGTLTLSKVKPTLEKNGFSTFMVSEGFYQDIYREVQR